MRSWSQRFPAAFLFVASISAVLPVVRFCPLGWDEIDLATLATCEAMPASAECAPPEREHACSAGTGCGATAACPMRSHGSCSDAAGSGAGASAAAACPESKPAAAGHSPARRHHAGPGWCISEPLIAAAARAHAPATVSPLAIAALLVTIDVPATVRPAVLAIDARPPTAPHLSRPPIRGPPLLLG